MAARQRQGFIARLNGDDSMMIDDSRMAEDRQGSNTRDDDDETLTQIAARVEEKSMVPLEEYQLPSINALCFGFECCTCSSSKPESPCVC